MLEDAGREMKARLRAALRAAMKDRRSVEAEVIRTTIAAIDNAEAPPMPAGKSLLRYAPGGGSAEAKPLVLSKSQVHRVLLAECKSASVRPKSWNVWKRPILPKPCGPRRS